MVHVVRGSPTPEQNVHLCNREHEEAMEPWKMTYMRILKFVCCARTPKAEESDGEKVRN